MVFLMLFAAHALLCAGSALGCAFFERRFEEFLPLSLAGIVLVQLLFGLLGALNAGFWTALLLCAAAWPAALWRVFRRREGADFARRFFDGPFFLFLGLGIVLAAVNYGKLLASWDEFSHWGDVVRMMLTQKVLSIDPASRSLFPEYPPAMALLQYFFARICQQPGGEPAEWLFYYAYQLSLFALFFPLLRETSLRKFATWLLLAGVFLLPMVFQPNAYAKIYIDSFLGVLFGLVLYWLLCLPQRDRLWMAQLCALLFLLTLSKALGLAFALAALAVAAVRMKKRFWAPLLVTVLSAAAWWGSVFLYSADKGPNGGKMRAALSAHGVGFSAYHLDILKSYLRAFLTRSLTSEEALLPELPALLLIALLLLGLRLVLRRERRKEFWLLAAFHLLYAVGIGMTFIWLFPEREAQELLGMERYWNNLLLADGVLLFLAAARKGKGLRTAVLLLTVLLLLVPLKSTARFLTRREVLYAQQLRAPYTALEELIRAEVPEDGRLLVYTGGDSLGGLILRSTLRPRIVYRDREADAAVLASRYDYVVALDPESGENTLSRVNSDGSLTLIDGDKK